MPREVTGTRSRAVVAETFWAPGESGRTTGTWRRFFATVGGATLADTAGGKDQLRSIAYPRLAELIDELCPSSADISTRRMVSIGPNKRTGLVATKTIRIRDNEGGLRGTVMTHAPAVGMHVLDTMALERDPGHLARTRSVANAGRRPGAILFADLEGSSVLSRTLSTSSYLAAGRRLVRATDRCVVVAGGLVGRHVGDGVVAFFPVEVFDSESAAATSCIRAALDIEAVMPQVASRCGLPAEQFGDAVRSPLEIDPDHIADTQLANLTTAIDKARRDPSAIAVCEM